MGNNNNPSYVFLKGTTFYFNRHVPKDVREYYKSNRIILCLKTSRRDKAIRMAKSIAQRLEDYWLSLRLSNMDIPAIHLLKSSSSRNIQVQNDSLSDALELYLKLKGVGKNDTFIRGAKRNIQSVIDVLGDRGLDEYSSSDAAAFRDFLLSKGLTTNSVKRNFATIRSIVNLCIQEHGLDCKNAFSRLYLPNLNDSKKLRRKQIAKQTTPNKTHQRPLSPSLVFHVSPPSNTLSVTLYESAIGILKPFHNNMIAPSPT